MFAYVPTVIGAVVSVVSSIPSPLPTGQTASMYASCGSMVIAGWNFDGNAFTPPPAVIPAPPAPTTAQIAAAAAMAVLNNGIAITSTSTPALNATYGATASSIANIDAVVEYINTNGTFPEGSSTMPWEDSTGAVHTFPSTAIFKSFATKIADYVAIIEEYANSGGTVGSLPTSNAVTIA